MKKSLGFLAVSVVAGKNKTGLLIYFYHICSGTTWISFMHAVTAESLAILRDNMLSFP